MEYKESFILGAMGQIVGYTANYLVIWLLLQKFESINGWGWTEIAFLYSLNLLTYAIGASFVYSPMIGLGQILIDGKFEQYITKPLASFPYFIASLFNIGYIAHILISGTVLIWSLVNTSIDWTIVRILYLILAIISASFLQAAFMVAIGSLSFYFLRVQYLFTILFRVREFIAYPISVYGTFFQIILTWIIPLAMINYYPSLFLFSHGSSIETTLYGLAALVVGPVVFILAYQIWRRGINRYSGAGG